MLTLIFFDVMDMRRAFFLSKMNEPNRIYQERLMRTRDKERVTGEPVRILSG
jgi:hypothetical protein